VIVTGTGIGRCREHDSTVIEPTPLPVNRVCLLVSCTVYIHRLQLVIDGVKNQSRDGHPPHVVVICKFRGFIFFVFYEY